MLLEYCECVCVCARARVCACVCVCVYACVCVFMWSSLSLLLSLSLSLPLPLLLTFLFGPPPSPSFLSFRSLLLTPHQILIPVGGALKREWISSCSVVWCGFDVAKYRPACVFVCVCVYTKVRVYSVCRYMCVYMYTLIYIYVCIYTRCACVCVCVRVWHKEYRPTHALLDKQRENNMSATRYILMLTSAWAQIQCII